MVVSSATIDSLLKEREQYPPSAAFRKSAHLKNDTFRQDAAKDPGAFWSRMAKELDWIAPWSKVLEWNPPFAKWFLDGKLNVSANCLDRHLAGPRRNKAALVWEGEPGERRVLTYHDMWREVSRFANVLKSLGVKRGDRVTIYMPMIPELPIAMLACARVGAVHSVIFGGFSARAIRDRAGDAETRVIVTADGGYRRGTVLPLKKIVDEALFWCTADIGWVTGHSYIVYGPLANGASVFMYEGAPDWPEPDRFWRIVEEYDITILYTAPTAIRAFMRWGDEWPKKHDLSSLRLLGTVGEPINPEAWRWYHKTIGGDRCPIVDTWWQTETGMILITPLPGVTTTKPGSATHPFPGIAAEVVDEKGRPVPVGKGGYLVISKPWPAMLMTLYRDPDRYRQVYWSQVPGKYFTGDGARIDEDGYFWLMGRIDDVINVAGHRIGTHQVESALVCHPKDAEAAVVGKPHPLKGQALVAYVVLKGSQVRTDSLTQELRDHVRKEIGAIAVPDEIYVTGKLPKTRSGKIMRRVIRSLVSGQEIGDTTTLEDPDAVEEVRKWLAEVEGPKS